MKTVRVKGYYRNSKRKRNRKSYKTLYKRHEGEVFIQLKDGRAGYIPYSQLGCDALEFTDLYGNYSIVKKDDIKMIIS